MSEEFEELNHLLYIVSLVDQKLSGLWKYAARILISSIVRRAIIDEVSFQVIIQKGVEEGFLVFENNEVKLTQTGSVHLNHISPSLRFGEEVRYQLLRIRDLSDEDSRTQYINSLQNELMDALDYSESRKVSTPTERILVNGFIGEVGGKIWTFSVTSNDYLKKQDFYAKGTLIQKLVYKFCEKSEFCQNKLGYDKATFFMDVQPDKEMTDFLKENGFYYVEEARELKVLDLERSSFEYLIAKIVERHLMLKKLVKIGQKFKFIDFSDMQTQKVRAGQLSLPLKIFNGFNVKINKIKENQFLLWIDPTYMQFYTIDKWIETRGFDAAEEIISEIQTVDVLPNKSPGKLISVDVNAVVPPHIKEIWKNKYNFELYRTKGMAKVRFDEGKDYDYPLETLSLGRKWIEKNIGFLMIESPAISPQERFKETQQWFDKYFKQPLEVKFGKISFKSNLTSLNDVPELFRSCYELLPPILVFSKKDIARRGTDSRGIFKYGGYSGDKCIFIFRILCSAFVPDIDCQEFVVALKRTYDSIFGTLEYETNDIRIPYPDLLLRESAPKIEEMLKRKLEVISSPKGDLLTPISIVVGPNQQHIFYYITKGIINDIWRIPDQYIRLKTFDRILRRDLPVLRGFALQIYLKSLKPDESPWILRYPSDSVARTVYCGIGFSMHVKTSGLRKSIGILAICDAQGKFVHQKHLSLSKVSSYISEEMLQKLFSFITEKTSDMSFDRLVIYRKGRLKPDEKATFQHYLKELKETENWRDKKIDVVTVEEDIYRLFEIKNDIIVNVNSGSVVEFSNTESLICVSGHPATGLRHGTAKLLNVNSEISESGKAIYALSREYYDRTFLNWMAPVTLSKYPPELNISQKIAEITKEVDINQDFTYLQV